MGWFFAFILVLVLGKFFLSRMGEGFEQGFGGVPGTAKTDEKSDNLPFPWGAD